MNNLDKYMNLEAYETSKILIYCEARLGLIPSYMLNFNGKNDLTQYMWQTSTSWKKRHNHLNEKW